MSGEVVANEPAATTTEPATTVTELTAPATEAPATVTEPTATDSTVTPTPLPPKLPVVEVRDLDWQAIRACTDAPAIRARMSDTVRRLEAWFDRAGGPTLLFDDARASASDRALQIVTTGDSPLWIIGDLHGDLLALEAALAQIRLHAAQNATDPPRLVFLGDFVDDEGFALETLLRVFELILEAPERVCVLAGNHDVALAHDGARFTSTVSPSDFAEFLNANLSNEWIVRAGKLALRLTEHAPRALFFPDGLLVAHAGFPLADLHAALDETGDWNAPACLADFVWVRAHPKARKKLPNRFSRGSQFGYEDFAEFCALSKRLARPVTHMVRGHDHPEDRYAIYPAYQQHPVLTTVALSRRLPREQFGPYERAPTIARFVPGSLPQVYQLYLPAELINDVFPRGEGAQP